MQGTEISGASKEIAQRLLAKKMLGLELTEREIWQIKLEVCRQFKLDRVPNNSDILMELSGPDKLLLRSGLRRKNARTSSGIAVITVITKPFHCPHGTCSFCPGGVRIGTPQSYTRNSPAAMFGIERQFDPKLQVTDMLEILQNNGHDTSKIEMILLGGTILAMPVEYQRQFVKNCFDALNGTVSGNLEESIRNNEVATHRCVGLTIETKPDWCGRGNIDTLLSYGTTRVEIGVQSLRQEVLDAVNRGHTVEDTIDAFQIAKDSCYKIVAHMMPGLPKSDLDKDLEDLLTLVRDERYKPDMLKIYPTLVVQGTALYQLSKMGKYTPYNLEQLKELLCRFKSQVPPWVRIMRIQREIPKEEIAEGTKAGNLRQIVLQEMKRRNLNCRCIRCREVGHRQIQNHSKNIQLERTDYSSSGGDEVFLSFENRASDSISGFLRLRIPSGNEYRPEIRNTRAALVRELHVYGMVVPVGQTAMPESTQHQGIGSKLLFEAEGVAKEFSRSKIVVIAAVGTREYYRKRGYTDDGPFVSKRL
jgi:elongator complex protein 3